MILIYYGQTTMLIQKSLVHWDLINASITSLGNYLFYLLIREQIKIKYKIKYI